MSEKIVEISSNTDKMQLYSSITPITASLRIKSFFDEKDFFKFIKSCEKMIRGSIEYRVWREYIIDILKVNECALTHEKYEETNIEIHHHIPSLYILIKCIITKFMEESREFSSFDICTEAIEQHFLNNIGYIALLSDLHTKFHNGHLVLPIELVRGNFMNFMNIYGKYLEDQDLEVINSRLNTKFEDMQELSWEKDKYPGIILVKN